MKEDKVCTYSCKIDKLHSSTAKNMREKIDEDYHVNMWVIIPYSLFNFTHLFPVNLITTILFLLKDFGQPSTGNAKNPAEWCHCELL